jgi:hypothetical protein
VPEWQPKHRPLCGREAFSTSGSVSYRQETSKPTPGPYVWLAIWLGELLAYASVDPLAQ